MDLKYFGEINPSGVEEYYDIETTINGNNLEIDINFENEATDERTLATINGFLNSIDKTLEKSIELISQDFDLGDESKTAINYLNHHLEILNDEEIESLFGSNDVSKEKFLSSLIAQRVGFYPEDKESFMLVDVTLKGGVTDYLMSVTYGDNGGLSFISLES